MPDLTPADIERLLEAATPGRWRLLHDIPNAANAKCDCAQVWSDAIDWPVAFCDTRQEGEGLTREQQMKNARLIAAAPAAIRSLLSRTRALEAALSEIEKHCFQKASSPTALTELAAAWNVRAPAEVTEDVARARLGLEMVINRVRLRIDSGKENVAIGQHFAAQIVSACRAALAAIPEDGFASPRSIHKRDA